MNGRRKRKTDPPDRPLKLLPGAAIVGLIYLWNKTGSLTLPILALVLLLGAALGLSTYFHREHKKKPVESGTDLIDEMNGILPEETLPDFPPGQNESRSLLP